MIARSEASHSIADRFDDAGSFMPADHGQCVGGEVAEPDVFVGVAESGVRHPDEHFLGTRFTNLEFVDDPGGVDFIGDGSACLHG